MKTNNPLTVENIVKIFNCQPYTVEKLSITSVNDPNRFKITDYNNLTQTLLNFFFLEYRSKDLNYIPEHFYGTPIMINERYKLRWLENISRIQFVHMYPNIMAKLWKEDKVHFNIYEFGILFSFMVDNIKPIKANPNLSEKGLFLFRYFINYTFGASQNPFGRSYITMDNHDKIVHYAKETFEYIMEKNIHNIFYIDSDTIYLDYVSPEVISNIKLLGLPYKIENNLNCMFVEKKKYQVQQNGILKVRGIATPRSKYQKEKNRINKLQRIVNIINENRETEPIN